MLEITAGVGGQEAMIFSQELFGMYHSFAHYRGWQSEIADYCPSDMGIKLENKNYNSYFIDILVN